VTGRIVVGADGALGGVLVGALGARGVALRHPSESLAFEAGSPSSSPVSELADAAFVVNLCGPRVRPGLGWADYLREHVGTASAVARAVRPGSHLVHFGSAAVYGRRDGVVRPGTPEAPASFPNPSYAWAKLAGELAVRAICRERGVGLTVLRPTMVYGPGVTSAIDTVLSLARRGVRLDLRPGAVRQHGLSVALLGAIVERLEAAGPQERTLLACDPFVFTNADLDAAVRSKFRGVSVPAPLPWAEAVLRRWPLFPDRDPPGALAALAFLGLDNVFDGGELFELLGIDASHFDRAHTLDVYLGAVR
jgi:nucleoside-diphosphate-sugar epimerase